MIRPAETGDLPQVEEIRREYPTELSGSGGQLEKEIGREGSTFLVDERDARLVGYVILRGAADTAEVIAVAVRPQSVRRGVGRGILHRAMELAAQAGVSIVRLEVESSNLPARTLYDRLGFRRNGIRKDYYGAGRDALLMETVLEDSA